MKLTGIHFLLSYRCTDECGHCFLWSSPRAGGTMTLAQVREVLHQAKGLGTVEMVYFEGGEPFLFYPIMLAGLREAATLGMQRGIVTNNYWATSVEDAVEWMRPIAEIGLDDLSLSSALFHGEAMMMQSALTFATDFVADAQMAALIRAAYDPVLPVASDQPTHALRLAARMAAQA